jgi:large subunit ribosomal protein L21
MIAVVKVGGHQVIVEAGEVIRVDKIKNVEVGETIELEILMISEEDGKGFKVGTPLLTEKATATIVEHGRDKKIRVFKMKPRKRYSRTYGHRQDYTVLEIVSIGGVKAAPKKATETTVKAETTTKAPKKQDITLIEGIGPKLKEILTEAGFGTFETMAEAKAEELKSVLEAAGARYKMFDPTTWPAQATLAATGKWDELKKLQDELDGGRAK